MEASHHNTMGSVVRLITRVMSYGYSYSYSYSSEQLRTVIHQLTVPRLERFATRVANALYPLTPLQD